MEDAPYITVVDVRDYAYCPRVVYFTHVLHLKERITEAMQYGKEHHEDPPLAPLMPKLKPKHVIKNVELTSSKLKLMGKVDTIVVTKHGEYIPVEVKWSEPRQGKPRRQHKAQLIAYALLIEENYSTTVKRAVIYYSRAGRLIEMPITSQDKRQVKRMIKQIYQVIRSEEMPEVKFKPKQCVDCGYKCYCQL
ncbi:MAG: CRISPR-associated protein Cas4 [Thermoprotei archaeon]|nr:MAG: CRISPR-associated protein Cas4 [Thermoprotei archaeon]